MNHKTLAYKIVKEVLEIDTIYYSVVKKESESGLIFNERLLVIRQKEQSIFYTKDIPAIPFILERSFPKGKKTVHLSEITLKNKKKGRIQVMTSKKTTLWAFNFATEELAEKWVFWVEFLQEKLLSSSCSLKRAFSGLSINSLKINNNLKQEQQFDYKSIISYDKNIESIQKNMQNKMSLKSLDTRPSENQKSEKVDQFIN